MKKLFVLSVILAVSVCFNAHANDDAAGGFERLSRLVQEINAEMNPHQR